MNENLTDGMSKQPLPILGMEEEELQELIDDCTKHGSPTLQEIIARLTHPGRRRAESHYLRLSYDKEMQKIVVRDVIDGEAFFCCMIVFHGWPETGFKHNGSFQLDPHYGWSSHT